MEVERGKDAILSATRQSRESQLDLVRAAALRSPSNIHRHHQARAFRRKRKRCPGGINLLACVRSNLTVDVMWRFGIDIHRVAVICTW